jgi:glycerol-3-phosphate dehydrogenase subunit B
MRALELECDSVIVGGGLAGLVASMRLPGSTILVSGGLGATAVSGGAFYSCGGDPEAEEWFLTVMAGAYVRGKCMTMSGMNREGLVPISAAYDGSPVPIVINEDRPGFTKVEFMKGRSCQEIAHLLDMDIEAADALADALSAVRSESVLVPPVLGVERAKEIRERVSRAAGKTVYEYIVAPSVLGLRLIQALRKKATANERLMMLDIVQATRIVDGHIEGVMGTKEKRSIRVGANDLFIATGGPMTGFMVEGERVFEPLTGMTVTRDLETDLNSRFFSEHPLMYKGIEPEPYIHGFDHVRAIGAVSRGFGLYKALVSGYRAGDGLE